MEPTEPRGGGGVGGVGGGLGKEDDDRLRPGDVVAGDGTIPAHDGLADDDGEDGDGDGDGDAANAEAETDAGGDSSAPSDSSNSARYRRGDRVYARDDSARRGVYEATIREVEHRCHDSREGDPDEGDDDRRLRRYTYRYLVHYIGWNKKWDRWVDEHEVMDIDSEEGKEAAERLREEDRVAKERERARREQKKESKKRKRQQQLAKQQASQGDDEGDMMYEEEEVEVSSSPLHDLPFTLRTVLIDDRENITRRCHQPSEAEWYVGRLLYDLPAPVTVKVAMDRFLSEKEKKLSMDRDKLGRKEKGKEKGKEKEKEKEKDPPTAKEKDPPAKEAVEKKEKEKDPLEKEAVDRKGKVGDEREGDTGATADPDGGGGGRGGEQERDDRDDDVMRSWRDTVEGLLELFDVALPLVLLYEQERLQYASSMRSSSIQRRATAKGGGGPQPPRPQPPPRPCEMYGCEHLLRLFVRVPAMIEAARFASKKSASTSSGPPEGDVDGGGDGDDGNVNEGRKQQTSTKNPAAEVLTMMEGTMVDRLGDVVRYLQSNVSRLFRPSYREPHERELTSAERALRERAGRKRAKLLREREKEKGKEDVVDKAAATKKAKTGGDVRTASAKSSR